jgi:hypothetical protein
MQPILVDRGQLVGERLIEIFNDFDVTLHTNSPDLKCQNFMRCSGHRGKRKACESRGIPPVASDFR